MKVSGKTLPFEEVDKSPSPVDLRNFKRSLRNQRHEVALNLQYVLAG